MSSYPNDWHSFYLKNIAKNVNDKNTNKEFINVFTNSAVEGIINQTEFFNKDIANEKNTDKYTIVRENDFVYNPRVSLSAPYGPININESNLVGVVSPLYTVFRIVSSSVSTEYMKHYFRSTLWHKYLYNISNEGARHDRMSISLGDFFDMPIRLPKLHEQKKIAEILSTWDEAIETNETLISLYEKYLNSLALSLVKKKILINENGWKQTKLKDVFYDRKSYGCQSDNLKLHSLTIEDGVTAKTDRYNREFLVKGDSKKYKIAKLHDLVFNPQNLRYGAIAVNSIEHDVLLSPIYATLEIKDPTKYDIGYLGYLLTSKEMISFYDSIAEGTLVERMAVKPDVFLNQVFSIPDIATQKKIANILNTFKKKIDLFKKNKAELEKQKQGLMQRLLTGKVRVKLD
jgi:type I restriction enzyme S subunit